MYPEIDNEFNFIYQKRTSFTYFVVKNLIGRG